MRNFAFPLFLCTILLCGCNNSKNSEAYQQLVALHAKAQTLTADSLDGAAKLGEKLYTLGEEHPEIAEDTVIYPCIVKTIDGILYSPLKSKP